MTTTAQLDLEGDWLPEPGLTLRDGVPYSETGADIYHQGDGIAESESVFLSLNHLPERFAAMTASAHFHIGETGFGTGLNALLACALFLRRAPADAFLHITSFECSPLRAADYAQLLPLRRPLAALHAFWSAHAPPPLRGWHRRWLHPRVRISLYQGDASAGLRSLHAAQCGAVDAWFLDGFAPDRNPELWTPELLAEIGSLSTAGSTLATFTSAGHVRRGLEAAGFRVQRVDGQPHKRHHLKAEFAGAVRARLRAPPPARILGAGIAGSALAHALRQRGGRVLLYDPAGVPPGGASANPAVALQTRLPRRLDLPGRLRLASYAGSAAWLALLRCDGWQSGGLLHLGIGRDAAWLPAFARLFPSLAVPLDAADAAALAGIAMTSTGVLLRGGGQADLGSVCRSLVGDTPIQRGSGDADWAAMPGLHTVYATPSSSLALPLHPVPGTVTLFAGEAPRLPLSGAGYVLPLPGGRIAAGGTYDRAEVQGGTDASALLAVQESDARNALRVTRFGLPAPAAVVGRFQGTRFGTPDRLPLVGRLDRADDAGDDGSTWISTGFASSGLCWSHLAAEIIASAWCREPPPLDAALIARLQPQRFKQP